MLIDLVSPLLSLPFVFFSVFEIVVLALCVCVGGEGGRVSCLFVSLCAIVSLSV